MGEIQVQTRWVYHAPTRGRSYLTARAAANQEASAMMSRKYPPESAESDEFGRTTDPGFHWAEDERLRRVRDRLASRILRKIRRGGPDV